ncbi:MFS transporter [Bradyrhizobium liaoningense]
MTAISSGGVQDSSAIRQLGAYLDAQPFNRRHALIVATCGVGFMFDAMDFQIMALVAPAIAKEWNLAPGALGLVLSATVLGMLVGSYLFGIVSDRFGRRFGFMATIALVTLFSAVCAFCASPVQLAIARFFVGLGIGGFTPVDSAVISEFLPARLRGRAISITFLFFSLGAFLAALLATFGMRDLGWRGLFMVGAAPAILVLFVRWLIPETPRFLLSRGRTDAARQAASWIADNASAPSLSDTGSPPDEQPASSKNLLGAALAEVVELFSATYRRRTIVAWAIWAFYLFSYFGMLLWLPTLLTKYKGVPPAQVFPFIMGFLACGVAGRLFCSLLIDRFGRKAMVTIAGLGAAVLAVVFGMQDGLTGLIAAGYAYAFFQDMGASAVTPLAPEQYPTRLRATGAGWAAGAGRLAAIFAPIAVGLVVETSVTAVFFILAAGFLGAAAIAQIFAQETAGLLLEDLEDGDGSNALGEAPRPEAKRAVTQLRPRPLTDQTS